MRYVCLSGVFCLTIGFAISAQSQVRSIDTGLLPPPSSIPAPYIIPIPDPVGDAKKVEELKRLRLENEALRVAIEAQRREVEKQTTEVPPDLAPVVVESARQPIDPDYSFRHLVADCLVYEASPDKGLANYREGLCDGYVGGILERISLPNLCIPRGAIVEDFKKVILKYADAHPDRLHVLRMYGVNEALLAAFPCRTGSIAAPD